MIALLSNFFQQSHFVFFRQKTQKRRRMDDKENQGNLDDLTNRRVHEYLTKYGGPKAAMLQLSKRYSLENFDELSLQYSISNMNKKRKRLNNEPRVEFMNQVFSLPNLIYRPESGASPEHKRSKYAFGECEQN